MKIVRLLLCKDRHIEGANKQIDGFIFPKIVNPMQFEQLEELAQKSILTKVQKDDILEIMVTGITSGLIACLNVCYKHNIKCMCRHWDIDTHTYKRQSLAWSDCTGMEG
jgi:hypothetical protein